MKEYPKCGKDERESCFGYRLSSAHTATEYAFDRLEKRFGCLRKPMYVNIKKLPHMIMSILILHNFCEMNNEMFA